MCTMHNLVLALKSGARFQLLRETEDLDMARFVTSDYILRITFLKELSFGVDNVPHRHT